MLQSQRASRGSSILIANMVSMASCPPGSVDSSSSRRSTAIARATSRSQPTSTSGLAVLRTNATAACVCGYACGCSSWKQPPTASSCIATSDVSMPSVALLDGRPAAAPASAPAAIIAVQRRPRSSTSWQADAMRKAALGCTPSLPAIVATALRLYRPALNCIRQGGLTSSAASSAGSGSAAWGAHSTSAWQRSTIRLQNMGSTKGQTLQWEGDGASVARGTARAAASWHLTVVSHRFSRLGRRKAVRTAEFTLHSCSPESPSLSLTVQGRLRRSPPRCHAPQRHANRLPGAECVPPRCLRPPGAESEAAAGPAGRGTSPWPCTEAGRAARWQQRRNRGGGGAA